MCLPYCTPWVTGTINSKKWLMSGASYKSRKERKKDKARGEGGGEEITERWRRWTEMKGGVWRKEWGGAM